MSISSSGRIRPNARQRRKFSMVFRLGNYWQHVPVICPVKGKRDESEVESIYLRANAHAVGRGHAGDTKVRCVQHQMLTRQTSSHAGISAASIGGRALPPSPIPPRVALETLKPGRIWTLHVHCSYYIPACVLLCGLV